MSEENKLVQKILRIAQDAIESSARTWFSYKKALIYIKALGEIIDLCLEYQKEK